MHLDHVGDDHVRRRHRCGGGGSQRHPGSRVRGGRLEVEERQVHRPAVQCGMLTPASADAAEIFKTPHQISFDDYYQNTPTERLFQQQSENYSNMFTVLGARNIKK